MNEQDETKEVKKEENKKVKVKEIKKKKVNKELEKIKNENEVLNEKLLRISAEVANMHKRFEEEKSKLIKYDGEEFIKELLPVIDNFERAIKLDDSNLNDELSKFLSGFKMIYGNIVEILNKLEVKEIDCLQKPFDPFTMEAVLTQKEENVEANTVIDVLQKGYMYKDKVIRVAMVKVSE